MWRRALISFFISLTLVLAIGLYIKKHLDIQPLPPQPEEPELTAPPPLTIHLPAIAQSTQHITAEAIALPEKSSPSILHTLVESGWPVRTAQLIDKVNNQWFKTIKKEDPVAYQRQITLLKGISKDHDAMNFVERHPETIGLIIAAQAPKKIISVLETAGENLPMLLNLYVLHGSPSDAQALTAALENNSDLIVKLYHRGLIGSEILFIFDRQDEAAVIYESWLQEVLKVKIEAPSNELASMINMLLKYGHEIRRRLKKSPDFRTRFRREIWPKLVRVSSANFNHFDIYLDDPRIWDLLALEQGEELLAKRGVLIPVDLLFGYPEIEHAPYPPELHDKVIQILLNGDTLTIQALMKFRSEPLFRELLRKPIPADVMTAALNKLFEAGGNYPELLSFYNRLSLEALAEEVGPAPGVMSLWTPFYYTVWEVPKKLIQGRSPTTTEWFNSIADPASFLLPLLKVGVAAVNFGKTLSTIDEDEPQDVLKKHAVGMEEAELQLGKSVVDNLGEAELINFRITSMLTRLQKQYLIQGSRATPFEITKPLMFMYDYSGEGGHLANIHRRFNTQLIWFPDRGFVVNLSPEGPSTSISRFFNNSVTDFAEAAAKNSDQAQALRGKNISAWWLLLAADGH